MTAAVVIAGIGSEYRCDDGAGPAVARLVAERLSGVTDIGPVGEPLDLLGKWDDAELAVIIDTVRSGRAPGTIQIFELDGVLEDSLVASETTSTHGIGFVGALRIAQAIESVPRRAVLVAIEGTTFAAGTSLSPAVSHAVEDAAAQVVALVEGAR